MEEPKPRLLQDKNLTVIDFNTFSNGNSIITNTYVLQQEWRLNHGIQVRVVLRDGGYAPLGRARILDTSNPGSETHLGSPNMACPGGGPGIGSGGAPNAPGENCDPQGNVLIIQESDSMEARANPGGGVISFDFDSPTYVGYVGLMGIQDGLAFIKVVYDNGNFDEFLLEDLGENAVHAVDIDEESVIRLRVVLTGTGTVNEIGFRDAPIVTLFEQKIPELTTTLSAALTDKVINEFGSIPGGCLENTTIAIDLTMKEVHAPHSAQCSDVAGAEM